MDNLCIICNTIISQRHKAISCDICERWVHTSVSRKCWTLENRPRRIEEHFSYTCPTCIETLNPIAESTCI